MSNHISYFPNTEPECGWRLILVYKASKLPNIDFNFIELEIKSKQLFFGNFPQTTVIIKDGYLIYENHGFVTLLQIRFDIWSSTKSYTGIAWVLLLDEIEKKNNFIYL